MKDEEVDRIFQIASGSFRTKWEVQQNVGEGLIELKIARKIALVQEKQYRRKCKIMIYVLFACIPSLFFIQSYFNLHLKNYKPDLLTLGVFFCLFIPFNVMFIRADKNLSKRKEEVNRCDSIFEKFAQSLSALDPIGTGDSHYDVINESYVNDKAITLAVRVVDAQAKFDALRNNPEAGRSEVIDAGEWMKKCESQLDKFESDLNNDFGQQLDRPLIFKAAEARLAKTRLKK